MDGYGLSLYNAGVRTGRSSDRSAFTLVEILVVVAIIALLAALGVPSILNAYRISLAQAFICDIDAFKKSLAFYVMYEGDYPDVNQWLTPQLQPYLSPAWPACQPFVEKWKWAQISGRLPDRILLMDLGNDAGPGLLRALQLVDDKIDDGNFDTGRLLVTGTTLKYYIIYGGEDLDSGSGNQPDGGTDPDNPGRGHGNH